jgi:hypothetical protein
LTYVLMDHPDMQRCNNDINKTNQQELDNGTESHNENNVIVTESSDSSQLTFSINNTGPAMSNMLDLMIAEQSKLLARKTKYEKQILQKKR